MKILIAGDFCPRQRVVGLIDSQKYDTLFGGVKQLTESADYSIVNLECPVVFSSSAEPILKKGPNLRGKTSMLEAVKWAGFNCVTLANNHFRDFGDEGVRDTIQTLDENKIDHVGGGMNAVEASRILYKEIGGKKLAVINCCEHEFSIATEKGAGCNAINPIQQYYAIKEAKAKGNIILVIVHGGHELYQLPSPRMQETYRFFIDAGADAVINHHQHCYSGYEIYNGKPIFYGLGNFCFDRQYTEKNNWNEGYMVELSFHESIIEGQSSPSISFNVNPYVQCQERPTVELMQGNEKELFMQAIESLNNIIADSKQLKSNHEAYMKKTRGYEAAFSPWRSKVAKSLFFRGWLPSFISKKKALGLLNLIECESHRERTIFMLNKLINKK